MPRTIHWFALIILVSLSACQVEAPPPEPAAITPTDIWLFERTDATVTLIARVTDRAGYDNQPMFTEDGRRLLFTSDRAGRMQTFGYDIAEGTTTQLTFTDADKYSPNPIPGTDGSRISVVHVDSTAMQELWGYAADGSTRPVPLADEDSVAYYTWVGMDRVLYWRLGSPATVRVLGLGDSGSMVLAEDSAFSFSRIPNAGASSYLARWMGKHAEIRRFDWITGETTVIAPTLGEGSDYAWTPEGHLLMAAGSELYAYRPGESVDWEFVAELPLAGGSRLAVSPDGSRLAVVGLH